MCSMDRFLYRLRRRRDRVDAVLRPVDKDWDLIFLFNTRPLASRRFADEAAARKEASTRLADLERVGWIQHW
jgi:hypothetical protein